MAASTSTAVPQAQTDDASRLRAVLDRTAHDVKDYTSQHEDQQKTRRGTRYFDELAGEQERPRHPRPKGAPT